MSIWLQVVLHNVHKITMEWIAVPDFVNQRRYVQCAVGLPSSNL